MAAMDQDRVVKCPEGHRYILAPEPEAGCPWCQRDEALEDRDALRALQVEAREILRTLCCDFNGCRTLPQLARHASQMVAEYKTMQGEWETKRAALETTATEAREGRMQMLVQARKFGERLRAAIGEAEPDHDEDGNWLMTVERAERYIARLRAELESRQEPAPVADFLRDLFTEAVLELPPRERLEYLRRELERG